jgi:protein-S-isoprenylcysteine O-methyltransferase Ste14
MTTALCRARLACGAPLADRLRSAHTHWSRLRGLLGTRGLAPGEGLWLRPCRQVHMVGMRYPVDVVFLDDETRVVRAIPALAPGRVSPRVPSATSVVELPAGTVARVGLAEGDRITIDGAAVADAASPADAGAAIACNLLLAALYVRFATAHLAIARATGQWATTLPLVVQEALLVILFLSRRRSLVASHRPLDWGVAIVGTLLPLLMRPTEALGRLAAVGQPVQVIGLALAAVAVGFLGRSVGVVAANRGIKTGGLYRVVRHPMYAAYLVSYLGYVLAYPSGWNTLIAGATLAALSVRAVVEERLLAEHDPAYAAYLQRTPWRFVPWVV